MKLAIHPDNRGFSDAWIKFCKENLIDHKSVDCTSSDIIRQLEDCQGLMWHWHHFDTRAALFARQLTFSLESAGKRVFPDTATSWHFDDKIGQKYLLEAIHAPLVPTYTFYSKSEAIAWASTTSYPKVFKLRGGAGSLNVMLVKDFHKAKRLIQKAFSSGFSPMGKRAIFMERLWLIRKGGNINPVFELMKGIYRFFRPEFEEKMMPRQKGYAYFQDYLDGNDHDTRIVVIGNRAFGLIRMIRENDFRASGSGNISYDQTKIDERCVRIAFDISHNLDSQCLAFDFVMNSNNEPQLLEISFGFSLPAYSHCRGFWDKDLHWHQAKIDPARFIITDFVAKLHTQHHD